MFSQFFENKSFPKKETEEFKPKVPSIERDNKQDYRSNMNDEDLTGPKKLKKYKYSHSTENLIAEATEQTIKSDTRMELGEFKKEDSSTETKNEPKQEEDIPVVESHFDIKDETLNYSTDLDDSAQRSSITEKEEKQSEMAAKSEIAGEATPDETETSTAVPFDSNQQIFSSVETVTEIN